MKTHKHIKLLKQNKNFQIQKKTQKLIAMQKCGNQQAVAAEPESNGTSSAFAECYIEQPLKVGNKKRSFY